VIVARGGWKVESAHDKRNPELKVRRYTGRGQRGGQSLARMAIADVTQAINALIVARTELEACLAEQDERKRERLLESARDRVRLGVGFAKLVQSGRKVKRRMAMAQLPLKLRR
jgi:hypothetical protein